MIIITIIDDNDNIKLNIFKNNITVNISLENKTFSI